MCGKSYFLKMRILHIINNLRYYTTQLMKNKPFFWCALPGFPSLRRALYSIYIFHCCEYVKKLLSAVIFRIKNTKIHN